MSNKKYNFTFLLLLFLLLASCKTSAERKAEREEKAQLKAEQEQAEKLAEKMAYYEENFLQTGKNFNQLESVDEVELFIDRKPEKEYDEIGILTLKDDIWTASFGGSNFTKQVKFVREFAKLKGANILILVLNNKKIQTNRTYNSATNTYQTHESTFNERVYKLARSKE